MRKVRLMHCCAEHTLRNFETIVLKAYRWLSENYEEGDCIYLFGNCTLPACQQ